MLFRSDDKYGENDVFELREDLCEAVFLDFRGLDLVKKVLNESEGAEESADPTSEEEGVEQNNADHIVGDRLVCRRQRILKRAEGACRRCRGAGITVDSGCTDAFERTLINASVAEALEVCVEEKGGVELYETALRRLMRGEPIFDFHVSTSLTETDALGADSDCFLKNVVESVLRKSDYDEGAGDADEDETDDLYLVFIIFNNCFLCFIGF